MRTILYVQGVIEIAGGISFFPAVNGGDAAVLFCFVFFYIFFAGGGTWSLDRVVLKQED